MADTHIILNPQAGSCDDDDSLARRVSTHLAGHVHVTCAAGDAERFAREAAEAGAARVVSVGGDGTLHEVVNGLMSADVQTRPALGIVPMGTGNDFCRTLQIPNDLPQAIDLIEAGHLRPLDVVRVDQPDEKSRVMINAATGGFSQNVDEWISDESKKRWGALAYLKAALEARHDIPEYELELEIDGEAVETVGCALMVANGIYAGGGMPLVPDATPFDGQLDVMIVQAHTTGERLRALTRFLFQQHPDDPGILVRRGQAVSVKASPTMCFNVDGEPIAETPVRFTVERAALQVFALSRDGEGKAGE